MFLPFFFSFIKPVRYVMKQQALNRNIRRKKNCLLYDNTVLTSSRNRQLKSNLEKIVCANSFYAKINHANFRYVACFKLQKKISYKLLSDNLHKSTKVNASSI